MKTIDDVAAPPDAGGHLGVHTRPADLRSADGDVRVHPDTGRPQAPALSRRVGSMGRPSEAGAPALGALASGSSGSKRPVSGPPDRARRAFLADTRLGVLLGIAGVAAALLGGIALASLFF